MAGKVEIDVFVSNSDLDIYNSFVLLSNLKKGTFLDGFYKDASSEMAVEKQTFSTTESSNLSLGDDSAYVSPGNVTKINIVESDCIDDNDNNHLLKYDMAYTQATDNLLVISQLFDSIHEQIEDLQGRSRNFCEDNIRKAENIISCNKLGHRLARINLVLEHVYKISEKILKLKHLFRSSDQSKYLKIKIEYHRSIINFFDMTKEISRHLNEDLLNFENCNSLKERERDYEEFFRIIQKLTLELHKSVDLMNDFRRCMKANIF